MTRLLKLYRQGLRISAAVLAALLAIGLAGCAGITTGSQPSETVKVTTSPNGRVMGGQQPIVNSTVQLYAVNTSAQQGASTALLNSTVTSDAAGQFSITGKYTCPADALVYITATGGDADGGANPAIALMAALGPCSSLTPATFININELTTVASIYALAQFMADSSHVGTQSGNIMGIRNAFLRINTLVNIATGTSPGPAASASTSVPTTELNSLANILATCINSGASDSTCSTLFSLALPSSGSPPTDTIVAALNIATHPSRNVDQLFLMQTPQAPFQPSLTTSPSNLTLTIQLTGSGLNAPYGIAIDSKGNAWVTNEAGFTVTEFSPQGVALSGDQGFGGNARSGVFLGAQGITIDSNDNIYVANTGGSSVIMMDSRNGSILSPTGGFPLGGAIAPVDVAADQAGNLWVVDFLGANAGYSVTQLVPQVLPTGAGGYSANVVSRKGHLSSATAVAIDPSGLVWVSGIGSQGSVVKIDPYNSALSSPDSGFPDNALLNPAGIAFDSNGNAWVLGQGGDELSGFTQLGVPLPTTPVYGALHHPAGVTIDAAGNIWVTNGTATGSISKFAAGTGVPLGSFLGNLNSPVQIAVDGSGNLWTANSGDNSVSIFLGLAAPTITPLVARTVDSHSHTSQVEREHALTR